MQASARERMREIQKKEEGMHAGGRERMREIQKKEKGMQARARESIRKRKECMQEEEKFLMPCHNMQ